MPGLVLTNVSKSFGSTMVLRNVSLELTEGELLVLLGPSGCGKSTLLRLIAGLEELDEGEIFIGDRRVDRLRPRDRNVALVFQNYSLYPHFSVEKNLAFPLRIAGVPRAERWQRVRQATELLGLGDKLQARPAQLSGGQRQRVALGRAIVRRPSLFLLDEPLSNLDADLRTRMRREIVRIQKELNTTTVHVTHDQAEALTMGDRVALLHKGELVQVGTPEELYRTPANLFVAQFVGHPKMNVIDGAIRNSRLQPFDLPAPNVSLPEGSVTVGLRPEHIRITPEGAHAGTVVSSEYVGGEYVLSLSYRGLQLTVAQCAQPLDVGASAHFSFNRENLLFFSVDSGSRLKL